MKNDISVLLVALLLLSAASLPFASAADLYYQGLDIVLNKQTPYPVEPGGTADIEVSLENTGTTSKSITLEMVPKSPFTLISGDKVKTFASIGSLSTVSQTYKLRIDDSAVSSEYNLEFKYYNPASPDAYVTLELPVLVQGMPKMVIEDIKTVPSVIEPGHEVELDVTLKNSGTGEANHLEMDLEAEADSDTGESMIVPVLSGGSYYIDSIKPGEEKVAKFKLDISNDAEYKSYISTLTINYKDGSGNDSSVEKIIGIPVRGSPVIEILSAKIDSGDFKVDIENIGTGTAKALKIEFMQDGEVKDSSVASELKPTRHKTLRFSGFRYGNAVVKISYLDESNEAFSTENTVTVKPSSSTEEGTTDYSGAVGILILLVLVEGYYIWRLRKKLKKKK